MCLMCSEVLAIVSLLSKQKYFPNDKRLISVILLVAFLFTISGWLTFAVEMVKEENKSLVGLTPDKTGSLGFSFGLAITSSILIALLAVQAFFINKGEYFKDYGRNAEPSESIYDNRNLSPSTRPADMVQEETGNKISLSMLRQKGPNPIYRDSYHPEVHTSRWSGRDYYNYARKDGIFKPMGQSDAVMQI